MSNNYTLCNLPYSGENPVVTMEILCKGQFLGSIDIVLYREVFPAAVENFIKLVLGSTYRVEKYNSGGHIYQKQIKRTYEGCKFFKSIHNNYLITGDIYNNDGTSAGTIYDDNSIPTSVRYNNKIVSLLGEYYYEHDSMGQISLVPYKDESTGKMMYDSIFMITLDKPTPSNSLNELDQTQIVIGKVLGGNTILDKMNTLIIPYAGRKYPIFTIGKCNVKRGSTNGRRIRK